jgi:hypothetical protein
MRRFYGMSLADWDKKSTHSTPRHKCRGLPFDKLKAPSTVEGLRVDTERRFLPRFKNRGFVPPNVSTDFPIFGVY